MLNPGQKEQIRKLVSSPYWELLKQIAESLHHEIQKRNKIKDTEWETLKELLINEGKCQGIKEFLQFIFNLTQ